MRVLGGTIILFVVLVQVFRPVGIMISFTLNQQYIAENLCEKRAVPNSCCAGSCYLTKELSTVVKEPVPGEPVPKAPPVSKIPEINWFHTAESLFSGSIPFSEIRAPQPWGGKVLYRQCDPAAVFKPPAAV